MVNAIRINSTVKNQSPLTLRKKASPNGIYHVDRFKNQTFVNSQKTKQDNSGINEHRNAFSGIVFRIYTLNKLCELL